MALFTAAWKFLARRFKRGHIIDITLCLALMAMTVWWTTNWLHRYAALYSSLPEDVQPSVAQEVQSEADSQSVAHAPLAP